MNLELLHVKYVYNFERWMTNLQRKKSKKLVLDFKKSEKSYDSGDGLSGEEL